MLAKILTTVAMAGATWLAWRIVASLMSSAAAPRAERPADPQPDDTRTISLVRDPETGVYRSDSEPRDS